MEKDLDFDRADWLRLETAIETIGDMIAYKCAQLHNALGLSPPDTASVEEINAEIRRLSKERLLCYDKDNNQEAITRAYTVYGPLLKMINKIHQQ